MAISGVVFVPARGKTEALAARLRAVPGVEVQGVGPGGVAAVMGAESPAGLRAMSEEMRAWDEVAGIHLAYLNWA